MAEKVALTTGANSGIGLAVTLDLAEQGFRSIGSVRSDAKAEIVHAAAAERGVEVETVILDIDDADSCERVIDEVRPDVLVNNAGWLVYAPVELVSDAEARALFETLAVSPIRLARLAMPHMRERGGGRIVQVSSLVGRISMPMLGWYSAAKHALEAVSDALRVEVASSGIQVVIVEPGTVGTNILGEFDAEEARFRGQGYDQAYDRFRVQLESSKALSVSTEHAAGVVRKAVTARYPKDRYLIGLDAQVMARTTFIPTRLRDAVSRIGYGL